MNKIKFIIESDLEQVALVGMSINAICTHIPVSNKIAYQIELCAVEAVNNSIIHAYGGLPCNSVEISFSYDSDSITLEVTDTGKSMDRAALDRAQLYTPSNSDSDSLSENGRGLAIIKEVMDSIAYVGTDGRNCFTMTKLL